MLNEIHRAKEGLTRLQQDVIEIRVLKEVLNSSPMRPVNGARGLLKKISAARRAGS
jgi:hypothetical protein